MLALYALSNRMLCDNSRGVSIPNQSPASTSVLYNILTTSLAQDEQLFV